MDPCGKCDGTGIGIDSLGFCCESNATNPAQLDAQGICCKGFVDECGVCHGNNACDLKAEFIVALASAVSYLMPVSTQNRQLKAALQADIAAALASATGRPFEKSRVMVLLSAYTPPAPPAVKPVPALDGMISASEGSWDDGAGPRPGPDAARGGLASRQAVAALPMFTPDSVSSSVSSQLPVQMDDIRAAPGEHDAPMTHANLAAQRPASASTFAALGLRLGTRAGQQGLAVSSFVSGGQFAASDWDVPPQRGDDQKQLGSVAPTRRRLAQAASVTLEGLGETNAVRVSVILKAPSSGSGVEMGSLLLAFNTLIGKQLDVPTQNQAMTYVQLAAVGRAGTCGDGICQVRPACCGSCCCMPDSKQRFPAAAHICVLRLCVCCLCR